MPLSCRFYQQKYPEIEDCVMVNVRSIADMGAYVSLLEYNNIEGMVLLSELSRRRIRSVNKLIRVGRSECVVVIRVDKEKGYIDLSKRRVYSKDLIQCEERFAKAKAVNSILRHVADQLGYDSDEQLEDLYRRTAWYFDQRYGKKAASYDLFKKAITEPTVLDECNLEADIKEKLLEDIRKRLTPQAVKIRADIEVSCYAYEGIDAVRAALKEGLKVSVPAPAIDGKDPESTGTGVSNGPMAPINEEGGAESKSGVIQIQLIAPPQYVVTTNTYEREAGLAAVGEALELIRASITTARGQFKVLMAPKVVTDLDEKEIKRKLELLELEGAEVPGDDEDAGSEGDQEGMQAPEDLDRAFEAKLLLDKQKTKGDGSGGDEEEGEEDDEEEGGESKAAV